MVNLLEPLRRLLAAVEVELKVRTQELDTATPEGLPVGVGQMTSQILEREVADWDRFQNRRQVTSYTRLCPREDTSSQRRFQGSINKHGNRRLRPVLVEGAWRLLVFQPEYRLVKKWRAARLDKKTIPTQEDHHRPCAELRGGLVVRAHRALQSRRRWTQTPTGAAAENPSQMKRPIFLMND